MMVPYRNAIARVAYIYYDQHKDMRDTLEVISYIYGVHIERVMRDFNEAVNVFEKDN